MDTTKKSKWIKVRELLKNAKVLDKSVEERKEGMLKPHLQEYNTSVYRTKYKIDRLRANTLISSGGLLNINGYMFLTAKDKFDDINVISKPGNSGSGSIVILLKKARQQFILKITFVNSYDAKPFNFPDTEAKMYAIMNILVSKNITPHVFMLVGGFDKSIDRNIIDKPFNTWLKNMK